MPIKTVAIVEDNTHDAENLRGMLERHFPELRVLAVHCTYDDALRELPLSKPDLLFLDINLPGGYSGFDILKSTQVEFNTIFTTAYDKYAIDAIRASALDYLLKPFDLDALRQTMERVFKRLENKPFKQSIALRAAEEAMLRMEKHPEKIMIHSGGSILFIDPDEVLRIEASGAYSAFILEGGRKVTASHNLQHYEGELNKNIFFRTHRSFIINISKVKSLKRNNNGGLLILEDNAEINITREKLEEFLLIFRKQP